MPIVTFDELKDSQNEVLHALKHQSYAPPFAIVPSQDHMNQGDVFSKDYSERHSLTILKNKNGGYFLGKKADIPGPVLYKYSQTLFQTLSSIISIPLNKYFGFNLMPQKIADFMLNSIIISPSKEFQYVNSYVGLRFLMDYGGEFYEINDTMGCVKILFSYQKNNFYLDKIVFTGSLAFEEIMFFCLKNKAMNKEHVQKYLSKKTLVSMDDAVAYKVNSLAADTSRRTPYLNLQPYIEKIYESFTSSGQKSQSLLHNAGLSNKRMELMEFLLDVLNRTHLNIPDAHEKLKNLLLVFKKINSYHTKEHGNFMTGAGGFDKVLDGIIHKL